jgi:hypothetical protein
LFATRSKNASAISRRTRCCSTPWTNSTPAPTRC